MDRQEPSEALKIKISHLKDKIEKPKDEMRRLVGLQAVIVRCAKSPLRARLGFVQATWAQIGDDDKFFAALQELVAYAYGESARVKQRRLLGAPQSLFSRLMRRINARNSPEMGGRPPQFLDFQRQ